MAVGALQPHEEQEIKEHLSRCPSCSEHERALQRDDDRLIALADSLKTSPARIQARVAAALEERTRSEPGAAMGDGFWRWIMERKRPVFAAAVAAAVLIIWGVGQLTGMFDGATPAFADVAEQIERARSVSYRQSFENKSGMEFTTRVIAMEPGLMRTEMPMGDIILRDFNSGKTLHLYPCSQRAIEQQRVGAPERKKPYNYLDWLESLHKEGASFVRTEELEDRKVNVFVNERDEFTTTTVWADADTDLPVRIEYVAVPAPGKNITVPSIGLAESDFGGSPGYSETISQSGPGIVETTTIIKDEFKWNVAFERALFAFKLPEGYALDKQELDMSPDDDARLVEALSMWTEMTGGTFPDTIEDICEEEKVKPLLIAKYDKDGNPKAEFRQAMTAANILVGGLYFVQEQVVEGTWYYAGRGVRLGEANKAICWWKPEDSEKYRVIYGDLRMADVDAGDLPE
jgi:hypothetical protein